MSTKLVNHIMNNEHSKAKAEFKRVMSEKVLKKIDQAKIEISSKLYETNN